MQRALGKFPATLLLSWELVSGVKMGAIDQSNRLVAQARVLLPVYYFGGDPLSTTSSYLPRHPSTYVQPTTQAVGALIPSNDESLLLKYCS